MKAVLMSIQPKWCELIANGKKTVEVRKTKPKLETPFKVYIYCTKGETIYLPRDIFGNNALNGKVIGEFVCDRVDEFRVFENKSLQYWHFRKLENSCLSYEEVADYIGANKNGYAWHISDLVIYDKPKKLSEFKTKRTITTYTTERNIEGVVHYPKKEVVFDDIITPPQSWCYCHFEEWGW